MPEEWKPGSFTKNFSWGSRESHLRQLYNAIKVGFADTMEDVERETFRSRVSDAGYIDYIPINFFLFNKIKGRKSFLIADELVFHALNSEYSARFDKLALFSFNFSYAGVWRGATVDQRRPALWSFHYIRDRVAREFHWKTERVGADDIESFVKKDPRYKAKTARKLATNLSYLYSLGRLSEFTETSIDRWWVDALFLALDRIVENRKIDGLNTTENQYEILLDGSDFLDLSGRRSLDKKLAQGHLIALYIACGGRDRFSDEYVHHRTTTLLPDLQRFIANDPRPRGAVHPSNPRILKSIPHACAMLARYAGFDVVDPEELASFDPLEFMIRRTEAALRSLQEKGVSPGMTAEELMKITRKV